MGGGRETFGCQNLMYSKVFDTVLPNSLADDLVRYGQGRWTTNLVGRAFNRVQRAQS